jgi:hypothetical protein
VSKRYRRRSIKRAIAGEPNHSRIRCKQKKTLKFPLESLLLVLMLMKMSPFCLTFIRHDTFNWMFGNRVCSFFRLIMCVFPKILLSWKIAWVSVNVKVFWLVVNVVWLSPSPHLITQLKFTVFGWHLIWFVVSLFPRTP